VSGPAAWQLALAAAGGGAAGALLRHLANQLFLHRGLGGLPASTLLVNVVGCFGAGLLLVWIDGRGVDSPLWRALLITGLLGGLTTFSALGLELWQLLRAERLGLAMLLAGVHVVAGVAAVAAGWRLGRAVWG
jgi:CrcB protein